MNTVGKILVILNLVFALVTGGFLVVDFATRTNWKNAYDQLKREMEVAKINVDTTNTTAAKQTNEAGKAIAQVEKLQQDIIDAKKTHEVEIANMMLQRDDAVMKISEAQLNAKIAQAENQRMQEEVKLQRATIEKREQYIAGLQDEIKKVRTAAITLETENKSMRDRTESLLAQLQKVNEKLAAAESGVGPDSSNAGAVKDPNQPNPPSSYVKGKVESVDPNGTLVKISLGSDLGLQRNHTLEVYRMTPKAQYLGMIRIVQVDHHQAIGRLMPSSVSGTRGPLREGDIVASSLSPP